MKNNKSVFLFVAFCLLVLLTVAATYYKYLVERDYVTIDDTEGYYDDGE